MAPAPTPPEDDNLLQAMLDAFKKALAGPTQRSRLDTDSRRSLRDLVLSRIVRSRPIRPSGRPAGRATRTTSRRGETR